MKDQVPVSTPRGTFHLLSAKSLIRGRGSPMIVNMPTPHQLDETALRLLFVAWEEAVEVCYALSDDYRTSPEAELDDYQRELLTEYIKASESQMSFIISTLQHAAELKLKSILCSVSPYLLLLSDSKVKFSKVDVDFSDLKTIDAVDLPSAVRSLTDFELPPSFDNEYRGLRIARNKFAHLGLSSAGFAPSVVLNVIARIYSMLWPDGKFLRRRLDLDRLAPRHLFEDGRYFSLTNIAMNDLQIAKTLLDAGVFKKCFGVAKSKIVGVCPSCKYAMASKSFEEPERSVVRVGTNTGFCVICVDTVLLKAGSLCDCGTKIKASLDGNQCCLACGEW